MCRRCLAAQPAFAGVDIEAWRARHRSLLAGAAFRIAPSRWTAATLERYFPECAATVIAHGFPDNLPPRAPGVRTTIMLPDDDAPTVAVLGAIGPDKGARRIERLKAMGVKLELGVTVDAERFGELLDAHDAVFLGTGAQRSRPAQLHGSTLTGVHDALDYLAAASICACELWVIWPDALASWVAVPTTSFALS